MPARDKTPKAIDKPIINPQLLQGIEPTKFTDGERAKLKYEAAKNKGKRFHKYVLHQKGAKKRQLLKSKYYVHFKYAVKVKTFPAKDSDEYILARLFIDDNKKAWKNFKVLQTVKKSNKINRKESEKSKDENVKYVRSLERKIRRLELINTTDEHGNLASDIFEEITEFFNEYISKYPSTDISHMRNILLDCCISIFSDLVNHGWFSEFIPSDRREHVVNTIRQNMPGILSNLSLLKIGQIDSD